MRLTSIGIVLALLAGMFTATATAQIPERVLFQPGSYAHGMQASYGPAYAMPQTQQALAPVMAETELDDEGFDEDFDEETDEAAWVNPWEEKFAKPKCDKPQPECVEMPPQVCCHVECCQPPYLAWHRCVLTGRVHLIPYQKGYPEGSADFPKHQSNLNLMLSSLPCREQNRPQVQYLGYHDPMPNIITDKPTRMQLLLGYPNAQWTDCCYNRYGQRLAQCRGVDMVAVGRSAERSIASQQQDGMPQSLFGHHGKVRHNCQQVKQPCRCATCMKQQQPVAVDSQPCDKCPNCKKRKKQQAAQEEQQQEEEEQQQPQPIPEEEEEEMLEEQEIDIEQPTLTPENSEPASGDAEAEEEEEGTITMSSPAPENKSLATVIGSVKKSLSRTTGNIK